MAERFVRSLEAGIVLQRILVDEQVDRWSFEEENMTYLTLPAKRPDYRKDRSHSNFLIQLKDAYQNQLEMGAFFDSLETVCHDSFDVEVVSLDEALAVVEDVVGEGGIQAFFETKSRTRLMDIQ